MENKVIKIIGIVFICIVLISIFSINNKCMAISDVTQNPGGWIPTDDDEGGDILNQKMGPVLKIIRNAGVIISVLTLSVIALKIMFSSVEGKADYKQKLLPWVVGAFMVFSMTTIPSLVYDLTYSGGGTVQVETSEKKKMIVCINGNPVTYVPSSNGYACTEQNCGCEGRTREIWVCIDHDYELKLRNGKWHCDQCGKVYN